MCGLGLRLSPCRTERENDLDRLVQLARQTKLDAIHTAIAKAAEKYSVTILSDCCTTVREILHLIALHALSTRAKLVPSSEVL